LLAFFQRQHRPSTCGDGIKAGRAFLGHVSVEKSRQQSLKNCAMQGNEGPMASLRKVYTQWQKYIGS
jgi:hypothetical protein